MKQLASSHRRTHKRFRYEIQQSSTAIKQIALSRTHNLPEPLLVLWQRAGCLDPQSVLYHAISWKAVAHLPLPLDVTKYWGVARDPSNQKNLPSPVRSIKPTQPRTANVQGFC